MDRCTFVSPAPLPGAVRVTATCGRRTPKRAAVTSAKLGTGRGEGGVAVRTHHPCSLCSSLHRRVAKPLEGRSSGFRISRSCGPSQPGCSISRRHMTPSRQHRPVASIRESSPVTATGSRRNLTGFPRPGRVERCLAHYRSGSSPPAETIGGRRVPSAQCRLPDSRALRALSTSRPLGQRSKSPSVLGWSRATTRSGRRIQD